MVNFFYRSIFQDDEDEFDDEVEQGHDNNEDEDDFGEGVNLLQKIVAPLISACLLMVRSSYIATNIVMMVGGVVV